MKKYDILTIGIDATETDQDLIAAAATMHGFYSFKEIRFIHVMPRLMNVAAVKDQNEIVSHSITEEVRTMLQVEIDKVFSEIDIITQLTIRHGIPYRELSDEIERISSDMLIIGVKKRSTSALTPSRLAHGVDCDLVFVPEGKSIYPGHIMVPVDLSAASGKAIKVALEISAKATQDSTVTCVHVLQNLPIHFYYGFEMNADYSDQRSNEAKIAFQEMMKSIGVESSLVQEVHIDNKHGNIAAHLNDYVDSQSFALIVMNAKGHSHLANFLVGSVAEKFVNYCREIPILLTR